jgi:translation initiation factor 2B subunit (eIF-2B alpha/beta/delta family)
LILHFAKQHHVPKFAFACPVKARNRFTYDERKYWETHFCAG